MLNMTDTMAGKIFIETHGCQMNEYDSAKMLDVLHHAQGMELTDDPEQADVLLMNTCSIAPKFTAACRKRSWVPSPQSKRNRRPCRFTNWADGCLPLAAKAAPVPKGVTSKRILAISMKKPPTFRGLWPTCSVHAQRLTTIRPVKLAPLEATVYR